MHFIVRVIQIFLITFTQEYGTYPFIFIIQRLYHIYYLIIIG